MSNTAPNGGTIIIPTISGKIENNPNSVDCPGIGSTTNNNMTDVDGIERPKQTLQQLVQLKFKDNEMVLVIFEAYQIKRCAHTINLLALVESLVYNTFAVFVFSVVHSPPRTPNDLTIKEIFAVDESFHMDTDKKGISALQFSLRTGDKEAFQYFYYPIPSIDAADFYTFQTQLLASKNAAAKSSRYNQSSTEGLDNAVIDYIWLNDYRPIGEAKQELKRREHEYVVYKEFTIYCATWNVNDKSYVECPLHLWLSACEKAPDIYAIALQELDTSKFTVARGEDRPDVLWINNMLENVHKNAEYEELTTVRLVGMQLTIIVRKQIRPYISRRRIKSIPRGVFKALGNKGGVAVSLQLNETNICFVNSHLAAHMKFVEERNSDYAAIVHDLVFDDDLRRTINDHDQIFWIGDLNYRIEEPPGLQLPLSRSDERAFEYLLPYDQLRQEMLKGNCFEGYTEGPITFRPTYKYDPGTDNFDSSEKQRAPAYCDRILWKGPRIEQLRYDSVMEIRPSDHKPVYAIFAVKVKTIDDKLYKRVHEEVLKLVDRRENENQPQVNVNKNNIDFGVVRFNEEATSVFEVSNICSMPVHFTNTIAVKWLQVDPKADTLQLEQIKSVHVKLLINASSIRDLLQKLLENNKNCDLDILVLQVQKGSHIFIPITGQYKPSCFGLSMETLCRTDRAIGEYTQAEIYDLMRNDSSHFPLTMPREFFFLMDHLFKLGNRAEGAFSTLDYRCQADFNAVRDWLDTWSDSEFPGSPKTAAEALLMLLDLPEKPLLYPFVEDLLLTNSSVEAMEVISGLTPPRRNVFAHLSMFLRDGIEKKYYNLHTVASIFGSILLRSNETVPPAESVQRRNRCRDFMMRILCSDMLEVSHSTTITSTSSPSNNILSRRGNNFNTFA